MLTGNCIPFSAKAMQEVLKLNLRRPRQRILLLPEQILTGMLLAELVGLPVTLRMPLLTAPSAGVIQTVGWNPATWLRHKSRFT